MKFHSPRIAVTIFFFAATAVFGQEPDLAERVSSVENELQVLNKKFSELLATLSADRLSPDVNSAATKSADSNAPARKPSDQSTASPKSDLDQKLDKITNDLEGIRTQVNILQNNYAQITKPSNGTVSSMLSDEPRKFDDAVRDSATANANINNISGRTQYVTINGKKWRVHPGKSVAKFSPSEPLQIEFDRDGGEVYTFFPDRWKYRNNRYEIDLTIRR